MNYESSAPPLPFEEKWTKDCEWRCEPWDHNLPQKGFITDFVAATRGIESPTNFCVWSALFLLSSLVKRDVWLKWFPGILFCNLYVLFVAPPRICPKTTAIKLAEKFVYRPAMEIYGEHSYLYAKKSLNVLHSRATMESLFNELKPVEQGVWVEDGNERIFRQVNRGSQLAMIVSEFTTFLGKQQYNVGLVDKLTDWYDCQDEDDSRTKTSGSVNLKDIYITILGGTTFDGLKLSIPPEALRGGFVSRLIMVTNRRRTREFPEPIEVHNAPTFNELAKRLAWILANAKGEYQLSDEARVAYRDWYHKFLRKLEEGEYGEMDRSRMDINMLKVATLIRINRYEVGNIITLRDFEDAVKLIEANVDPLDNPLEDVGTSVYERIYRSVLKKFKKADNEKVTFRDILRSVCPEKKGGSTNHVREAIEQLYSEGRIKAYSGNNVLERLQFSSKEAYEWQGEQ